MRSGCGDGRREDRGAQPGSGRPNRDLPGRWKLLLDFLGTFRQGGARKPKSAEPAATEPIAVA